MIRSKIRKINPQKSNKMIWAVAGGLALVLLLILGLALANAGRGGGRASMAKTLDYLKNTEGLVAVKAMDAEKRAIIVFNSDSKNAGNFEKVAYYAALRLSKNWPDCEVQLAKNSAERIVYSVRFRAGRLVAEGPLPAVNDRP